MTKQKIVRTEEKFLIETDKKDELIINLRESLKADEYGEQGFYKVKSLYFDTPDFKDYRDKEENKEVRKGIRMRVYGKSSVIKLELKEKNKEIQKKTSIKIKMEDAKGLLENNYEILKNYDEKFYKIMKENKYEPKVVIFYDRYAFNSEDRDLRITIDSNLSMGKEIVGFFKESIEGEKVFSQEEKHIVEVKKGKKIPEKLKDLIDSFGNLEKSISKYKRCCKILLDR